MPDPSLKKTSYGSASSGGSLVTLKLFMFLLLAGWTVVIAGSLFYNLSRLQDHAFEAARIQALTAFEKDVVYRRWNSIHGGVFVPVEAGGLEPNPYLNPVGRDITDAGGKVYTKVNPAFMTRLVHEIGELRSGVRGHITSNNPIRPGNAPDEWESRALKQLEDGLAVEVVEQVDDGGQPYLRYISGLLTEESCLACHAFQGYQVGDVRGGISVSVPMAPFYANIKSSSAGLWLTHCSIWLLGVLGICFGTSRLIQQSKRRDAAEAKTRELANELEERVLQRTADLKLTQQELRAFVDNVDAGVLLKNLDGTFSFANARLASMFQLDPQNIIGRVNADLFPPDLAAPLDRLEGQVAIYSQAVEYRRKMNDNRDTVYSIFIFPVLEDKTVVGLGGLVVDVTDRALAEQALREARDAAEKANRAKSDFLANMSHEIRTPLNGVIGMADILMRTDLNQEQAAMAAVIKSSGDSLLLILNDILDLSKVEAGKLVLEIIPFRLRENVFAVARAVAHIAYKKNIELIVDVDGNVPDHLCGDALRIRQVLLNLVNNALKFTDSGEIKIKIGLEKRDQDEVLLLFSVTDTGIGIPEEKRQSIFNAFEQADTSTTRKYGGSGLGLAISASFLKLMNSGIIVESEEGKGSKFSFRLSLPIAEEAARDQGPPLLVGKRILLADRSRATMDVLARALRNAGSQVNMAGSLEEVKELADRQYDAIILGKHFVEANYAHLAELYRQSPYNKETPRLLMTEGLLSDELRGIFDILLDKPIRPSHLVRSLAELFGKIQPESASTMPDACVMRSLDVLLVEDVEINRLVASHMLHELGHKVTEAMNGQEALDLLQEKSFDLIFMDVQMPVMDGLTATRALRELEKSRPEQAGQIIIAMTANALKGDRDACLEAGMDGYISKPFQIAQLSEIIALHCSLLE